jgi:serralysin
MASSSMLLIVVNKPSKMLLCYNYNIGDIMTDFAVTDQTRGSSGLEPGQAYVGPVAGLEKEFAVITPDNLNITSLVPSVFIHGGSGMDGIDVSHGNGNNILDGGPGSNFMTGGTGNDTFYMDDRNPPTSPVFSTIANFHSGDNATVWGVSPTDFKMLVLDNQGAAGFTGLDLIFTVPGRMDSSFVLAGYTSADLTNGRLSQSYGTTPDLPGLPGSQYLTIHAS